MRYSNLGVSENGVMTIGGVEATALAKEYGTPLYVMDEQVIRKSCQTFKNSMDKYYDGKGLVCYASKAFSCKYIYEIAKEEGLGIDVVSIGELYTAMSVNFPGEKICYHGNNKTPEELIMAIEYGVGRIVVDNLQEIAIVNELAKERNKTQNVLIRVTPGVDAHTHEFIKTGKIDSKFGLAIELGLADEGVKAVLACENLYLDGIHCHIGSQIFDIDPFELAAKIMIEYLLKVKKEYNHEMKTVNFGGGFGIEYVSSDDPVEYDLYMKNVSETVKAIAKENNIDLPFVIIEPGRSIVGEAGVTLYTVGAIKELPNIRKYVAVDGGMTDNPRYALYQSQYDFLIANKVNMPKDDLVTVSGRCCESGDLLGENIKLQKAESGDILAVKGTGAYNYSMSSNYNRIRKPAVVAVYEKKSKIVVKRETLEDIIRNDI